MCCNTLEKWKDEIKNFFDTGITNAFTEGKNTKAKVVNAERIAEFPVMILEDYFQPLLGIKQTFDFVFEQEKNIMSRNAHNVLTYYSLFLLHYLQKDIYYFY